MCRWVIIGERGTGHVTTRVTAAIARGALHVGAVRGTSCREMESLVKVGDNRGVRCAGG